MYGQAASAVLAIMAFTAPPSLLASDKTDFPARPACLQPRYFSWKSLAEPENLFWPAYFWLWNGPLKPETLQQQLRDMAAHDARSVCALPMPHEFRPDSTNNQMDVDYLSPDFFERVKVAVSEAARMGMNYWVYDEGGWPSGEACGRVVRTQPDTAVQTLMWDASGGWKPADNSGDTRADLLNPQATDTFIKLTHQGYADAVGSHFGKTIKLLFTDEPCKASSMDEVWHSTGPHALLRWPVNARDSFVSQFGYDITEKLDVFRAADSKQLPPEQQKVRIDYFDFLSRRLREAYLTPLRIWSRERDLAQGGHVQNTSSYFHYGHLLRLLESMDVPGLDVVWRQVYPGMANHHAPKFAASAAHHNGTALALTESFCVYGNGLTPAQMKWVVDYQYVRGLTLLVCGCYPLSTRDHQMTGERPHFGPADPLWDFLPDFHRYAARLGYVLSCGEPAIDVGVYYPLRDILATGDHGDPVLRAHDALVRALQEHQCDFDVIDDDVLTDRPARVEDGRLVVGAMRYRTIVAGPARWMTPVVQQQLKDLEAAGGHVIRIDDPGQASAAVANIAPTVKCNPPTSDLRALVRRWAGGGAVFLFNEGQKLYHGTAVVPLRGKPYVVEPATGVLRLLEAETSDAGTSFALTLAAGESMLVVCSSEEKPAGATLPETGRTKCLVDLADGWAARTGRQYAVGDHDFEVRPAQNAGFQPVRLGRWAKPLGLGDDFSGHATYRRTVKLPNELRGRRLYLDLGCVEYAARVRVDGKDVGCVLWSPWQVELPPLNDSAQFELEIDVSNTLANELTSERVRDALGKHKGPGWPGPYHTQALKFEMESRGGGLIGPVRLLVDDGATTSSVAQFDVTDYGAVPGGEAPCTEAVQKAIDAAAVCGGTVVFKPGVYLSGSIFVKSGVHLRLDRGVELRAIQDDAAFRNAWRRVAGIEMSWPTALINVYRQSNVRISGEGVVDGDGSFWWQKYWGNDGKGGRLAEHTSGTLIGNPDFAARRPCLIDIYDSSDVCLEGLTLKRSPFWTVHPCYSRNVTLRGLTIRNNIGGLGPSTDAVDIDSCSDVLVEKCDIECNDDALCLKSGRGADGYRVNRPTERVKVCDCIVRSGHGGIAFGSEASGGFRDIEACRLKFLKDVPFGIRFKPGEYRGGVSENISIHDIEMEGVGVPISLNPWTATRARVPKGIDPALVPPYCWLLNEPLPAEKRWPRLKNVKIARVKAVGARQAFWVQWPDDLPAGEMPASDFVFEDVEIEAAKAGNIEHARDWTFVRTQIRTADKSSVTLKDASGISGLSGGADAARAEGDASSMESLRASGQPVRLSTAEFCATDYGAVPDGRALCTEAIQKAIDAASVHGGTVVFKPGVYLSGSLFVKSGVHLRLDHGVELRAIQDDGVYRDSWRCVAGIEMSWPAALVNVYKQSDVRIFGDGVIDGDGSFWWEKFWGKDRKGGLLAEDTSGTLIGRSDFAARRPCLIDIYDSSDVCLEGLTLKRSPFWTVHPCYSTSVTIRGVTIRNDIGGRGPSTDGIDIDSCSDVLVENCDIECNDDALCLKSGRGADGYRVNRPTERVLIRDCIVHSSGGGIAFGSEAAGGFRDIEACRLKFLKGVVYGLCIKPGEDRGGVSENIHIHHIEMQGVPYPVYLLSRGIATARIPEHADPARVPAYAWLLNEPVPAEKKWPRFRNFRVDHVNVTGASLAFAVRSESESPARGFLFEDMQIEAAKAGYIESAADWSFVRTQVKTADKSHVALTGSTGVTGLD